MRIHKAQLLDIAHKSGFTIYAAVGVYQHIQKARDRFEYLKNVKDIRDPCDNKIEEQEEKVNNYSPSLLDHFVPAALTRTDNHYYIRLD